MDESCSDDVKQELGFVPLELPDQFLLVYIKYVNNGDFSISISNEDKPCYSRILPCFWCEKAYWESFTWVILRTHSFPFVILPFCSTEHAFKWK